MSAISLLLILAATPAPAADWLAGALQEAARAEIPGAPPAEAPAKGWARYTPRSRLFSGEIPLEGWWPMEEETASGVVFRLVGPDSHGSDFRAVLSVRFIDKDFPGFVPIKKAVDLMRKNDDATRRRTTPVRPLRIGLGLARTFEVVETRRFPLDEGPAAAQELHHYVAVVPVGEAYYLVRLVTPRATYLDYREDFVRFLKSLRAIGAR